MRLKDGSSLSVAKSMCGMLQLPIFFSLRLLVFLAVAFLFFFFVPVLYRSIVLKVTTLVRCLVWTRRTFNGVDCNYVASFNI